MGCSGWACIPGRGQTRPSHSGAAALEYAQVVEALGAVDVFAAAQDGACASAALCGGGGSAGHVWRWLEQTTRSR